MTHNSLQVGKITVTSVSDGILKTGIDCILGLDPSESARLAGCAIDAPIYLHVNSFLIDLNGKPILVDTGAGNSMRPTLGKLPANLRGMGVAPESIETILLTHLHGDHANGLIDDSGRAVYPNATLYLHEQESRFYLERREEDGETERVRRGIGSAKRATAPYSGRIRTVPDGEMLPGITAMRQPGHTPGHTCWFLQSDGESLLIWGDIVHLASVQIPRPDVALVYDVDPALAPKTRQHVLDWAARERLRVGGAHLDFPGFARIERKGSAFTYAAV